MHFKGLPVESNAVKQGNDFPLPFEYGLNGLSAASVQLVFM